MSEAQRVVVVTGIGGMGAAIARRLGPGSRVVLADIDGAALHATGEELRGEGYNVVEHVTDVGEPSSVMNLADSAATQGRIEVLAHTAGLSPVQAATEAILKVGWSAS